MENMEYNEFDPYPYTLTDEERHRLTFWTICCGCAVYIGVIVLMLILCFVFGACTTTRYVPVVEHKTDTVWQNHTARDSIYVHDSIRVSEKGDTVRIDRWHTVWRDREVHDTLYISKTDTVPMPFTVEKQVPAQLNWWQRVRLNLANVMLWLAGIAGAAWIVRKKWLS